MNDVWIAVASSILGMVAMWLLGWVRTFLAKRVKVQSPESRTVQRIAGSVRRQSFLIEAGNDRAAMHAQAVIILANAVKNDDQAQVTRSLDIMSASESQFLASITARMTRDDSDIPDAEEADV